MSSQAKEQPLSAIFRRLISSLDRNNVVLERMSRKLEYHPPGSQAQLVQENVGETTSDKMSRDDQVSNILYISC